MAIAFFRRKEIMLAMRRCQVRPLTPVAKVGYCLLS
jgi:hypothetical protein